MVWALYALGAVYGFVLGACVASFLCVVASRVPTGESIGGRSHCACGRQLSARENVPVLGWLRARGVASCCGARIPRYLLTSELWNGLAGALVGAAAAAVLLSGVGPALGLGVGVCLLGFGCAWGTTLRRLWGRDG